MRIKMPREFYVPSGSVELVDPQSDAVAFLWSAKNGKPGATIFFGKQAKPASNFYYSDYARMDAAVARAFESARGRKVLKAERLAKRKEFQHSAKVGDIYRTSWGYDQTNIEYFEIVEIKGKYAILREIAQERVDTGFMQGKCVPLPGQYLKPRYEGDDAGMPIRRLIQEGHIKIDDVRYAWPEKGQEIAGVKVYSPSHWTAYA